MIELAEHQVEAVKNLGNGKILWGGVGSGKTITALSYYMEKEAPRDLYVITTAKKRDSLDWEGEAVKLGISRVRDFSVTQAPIIVDSWNNIGKYIDVRGAFFIFDEQRLVGNGAWVKSFLKIARANRWILLSATPGDTWLDYVPVFIANGYYKNVTEFKRTHVIYEPFTKFPKIREYIGERKLEVLRNEVLVEMPWVRPTRRILNYLEVGYDKKQFELVWKQLWNPFENRPLIDVAEKYRVARKIVNSDPSRMTELRRLLSIHPKVIVFYNFNYELQILRELYAELPVGEWNGHRKTPIPDTDRWVYLVQYVAGAEGWNCTETDAMVLYSLTYSYKNFMQAQGRIDRFGTKFVSLFYYVLVSHAPIDLGIKRALSQKKSFNEKEFEETEVEVKQLW